MKRLVLVLPVAVSFALAACSSHPASTAIDGKLSANARTVEAQPVAVDAKVSPSTTRTTNPRPPHTTRTSRPTPTTPGETTLPTAPPAPPTPSRTGVAGAVLYQTDCSADRPCSLHPGAAQVRLLDAKGNVVASDQAGDNGAFILQAPPGNYTLVAKPPSKKQTCPPVPVTVSDQGYSTTTIQCGKR